MIWFVSGTTVFVLIISVTSVVVLSIVFVSKMEQLLLAVVVVVLDANPVDAFCKFQTLKT